MEVRVLGSLEVLKEGISLPLGGPKQRTVLALLAGSPGHVVSTDGLIVGVYGPDAPPSALRTIHTYVSNLRHEVGDLVVRSGDGYKLALDESSTIDSAQFEELFSHGLALVESDPAGAATSLREGLSLWRGRAFADAETHGTLDPEITRLAELRVSALEARVEADLALGGHRELMGELEALCEEYPLRETFRAQHMVALYRSGRQAEALRAYTRTRSLLAEELGIDPSQSLQTLEELILTQDPQLDLPPAVTIERRAVLTAELGDSWLEQTMDERDSTLARRDAIISSRAAGAGGSMLDVRGNAALAVFPTVVGALDAGRDLASVGLRVAIDHGVVEVNGDRISGPPVNRSLRLAAIANPGQVIISSDSHAALTASGVGGWSVVSLGTHEIRGFDTPDQLFQLIGDGLVTDFGPLRLDRLPQPFSGDREDPPLPGYELRAEMGSNAFSVVNRAYQASVGREVAVRTFGPELASDPRFIRRFEAVAQRIAAVEHPHLVPLVDYWREPGRAVLVHRLIDGRTLKAATGDQDTPFGDPVAIVDKIGSSLVVAHQHGLVHGRVGMENVLLDRAGNPYLSDLGVASIVEGLIRGTAETPSTPQDDLFSLGVLIDEIAPSGEPRLRRVALRAATPEPGGRYDSVEALLADLRGDAPDDAGPSSVRNPYKGLASYELGDTADFFGRDELIAELVKAVATRTLTMVVGPSGIGKSSVVKAGLIPALRGGAISGSERWLYVDMYPGDQPFDALEDAMKRVALSSPEEQLEAMREGRLTLPDAARQLLPKGTQAVLVIDQFEELFTQVFEETERKHFLAVLSEVAVDPTSPVRVVATVRADFFDHPLQYAEFGAAILGGVVTMAAPTERELAAIVERPAAGVGVEMEPALVEALVEDAHAEIGGLPLLQHTLTELFERRASDRMALEDYRNAGGLRATIGRRAEQTFHTLGEEDRQLARLMYLALVSVDEDAGDTRRRVRKSELDGLDGHAAVERVLAAFGSTRLVVFDRDPVTRGPTVEVAHEALIEHWDRYRSWVDEVRDDLLSRRRVELATREWLESGEEGAYLLTGGRLERAVTWRDRSGMRVGGEETRFLAESRNAELVEQARAGRVRRRVLTGLVAVLAVVTVLGAVAWTQRNVANDRTVEARVDQLVTQANLAMEEDPNLAINLAVQAYDEWQSIGGEIPGELMAALQTTVQDSRMEAILPEAGVMEEAFGFSEAAWSPDSSLFVIGVRDELVVYETTDFTELARINAGGPICSLTFTPNGEDLIVGYTHFDPQTGEPEPDSELPTARFFATDDWSRSREDLGGYIGRCPLLSVSPDGRYLTATAETWATHQWDLEDPGTEPTVLNRLIVRGWVGDSTMAMLPPARRAVVFVDAAFGQEVDRFVFPDYDPELDVAINPVTSEVAVWLDGITRVFSPDGWEVVAEYPMEEGAFLDFTPDGSGLLQWVTLLGSIELIDLATGAVEVFYGNPGGVTWPWPSPDGRRLATPTWGGVTNMWDITPSGPSSLGNLPIPTDTPAFQTDDGDWYVVYTHGDGSVEGRRYEVGDDEPVATSRPFPGDGDVAFTSDGLIGGIGVDDVVRIVDIDTNEVVWELPAGDCGHLVDGGIDDAGRYAVISRDGCAEEEVGQVISLPGGETLFETDTAIDSAVFGRPGTLSEDLVLLRVERGGLKLYSLRGGEVVASMSGVGDPFVLLVSQDGRYMSWGSASGGATLIDLQLVLNGATMDEAVVMNPNSEGSPTGFSIVAGDYFAVKEFDRGFTLWDIESGEPWAIIEEMDWWLTQSADERYIYYDLDGALRRMPLDPEELVELARERSLRDFNAEECVRFLPEGTDCSVYER